MALLGLQLLLTASLVVLLLCCPTTASSLNSDPLQMTPVANCTLTNATLDRFRYLTFYGWHSIDGNWTNVGQSSSKRELMDYYTLTKRPSFLELAGIFFEDMQVVHKHLRGLILRPDWEARWRALVNATGPDSLTTLVQQGVITSFFLGDELVWNNITWDQLNMTSALVKATFPACAIFYNEGGAPLWGNYNVNRFRTSYPYVPHAIDFVSTDDYDSMLIRKNPRWQYESFLFPKMKAKHQRAFVIPPVYGWVSSTCNATCWDDTQYEQATLYFQWINEDPRIVGLSGFHFGTYGPHDLGIVSLPRTLACYKQVSAQLIQYEEGGNGSSSSGSV